MTTLAQNIHPGGLVPDAFLWLGPSWFNFGFSLELTVCDLSALFFVCLQCVLIWLIIYTLQRLENSTRAKHILCFKTTEIYIFKSSWGLRCWLLSAVEASAAVCFCAVEASAAVCFCAVDASAAVCIKASAAVCFGAVEASAAVCIYMVEASTVVCFWTVEASAAVCLWGGEASVAVCFWSGWGLSCCLFVVV